jgi:hypothetical protein
MSFASMTARAAGYVVKAATDWNVIVSNFAALWTGTTAGDTEYYTGAADKTRLPIGGTMTFMRSTGSAPAWGPLVAIRQGGSATVWTNPGTNSYTPTSTMIEVGYKSIAFSSSVGTSAAVTYPTAFTQRPAIFLSSELSYAQAQGCSVYHSDDTTTGFSINVKWTGATTGTFNFGWLAIGV